MQCADLGRVTLLSQLVHCELEVVVALEVAAAVLLRFPLATTVLLPVLLLLLLCAAIARIRRLLALKEAVEVRVRGRVVAVRDDAVVDRALLVVLVRERATQQPLALLLHGIFSHVHNRYM